MSVYTAAEGEAPVSVAAVVATVPPGRTAAPPSTSPTPRTAETVPAEAVTTGVLAKNPTSQPTPAATIPKTVKVAAATQSAPEPAVGQQIFVDSACIACHGVDLEGGIGPKLAGRTPADLTDERIVMQVTNGGGVMPPFGEILTKQDIQNVIAFIRSRQ